MDYMETLAIKEIRGSMYHGWKGESEDKLLEKYRDDPVYQKILKERTIIEKKRKT